MTPRSSVLSSPHQAEVVLRLATFRFLAAAQIADLVFETSTASARSRMVMAGRLLAGLRERGVVAATPRLVGGFGGGSSRPVHYLTPHGYRLARLLNPATPARRLKSPGTFLIRHALITADVALAFRRAAREHALHELVAWECDWQAAFSTGRSVLVPDAYLVYAVGARRLHAWLEVDLGTEHTSFFASKIRRYLVVYRSGTWRARLPIWPLILVVTENKARAAQLRRVTESVLNSHADRRWLTDAVPFAFAAVTDLLGSAGAFGPIWQRAGAPCRASLMPDESPSRSRECEPKGSGDRRA